MTDPVELPYGAWPSPIAARGLVGGRQPVRFPAFVDGAAWWSEDRPDQDGRTSVRRLAADGPVDVLPPPWSARSRVHEYGGRSWTATDGGALVFAEHADQRLYRLDPGSDAPVPLTAAPPRPAADRYADPAVRDGLLWCVRERHLDDGSVVRHVCTAPLDGSGADDPDLVVEVVGGSDFLTDPRVSPDGSWLAWIAWDHPRMPWDGSELRVAVLRPDGRAGAPVTVLGGPEESVQQPGWDDEHHLVAMSDRSGWWNPWRVAADGTGAPEPLREVEADLAGPPWQLGQRSWFDAGRELVAVRTLGTDVLEVLDRTSGTVRDVPTPGLSRILPQGLLDGRLLAVAQGAAVPSSVVTIDLGTGAVEVLRTSLDQVPDPEWLPEAQVRSFDSVDGRQVHAVLYPPRNPGVVGPADERPPWVAFVHGGPTAHVAPSLEPAYAYYTSRGIGVVDVNHGGSSGYGRAFRQLLRGQWGVVDVEDVAAAVRGLAEAGLADPDRLAIEGGSAGGFTVLSALTRTDAFACGVSFFGVADLLALAEETHDFESRYLDGLLGPLPQAREVYEERSPLSHVQGLSCPVLLLQGLDDPVVPPAQAEAFRDALVARGIPHAYVAYEGEAHGFRRAETIVHARESALSFLGQVLGFEPPDVARLPLDTGSPGTDASS